MSDTNYPPGVFAYQDRIEICGLSLSPPDGGVGFDDLFKLSHVTNSTFDTVLVNGGKQNENALDCNNGCTGNRFHKLTLSAGKECAVLLKDGFCNNVIDDCLILNHGGNSDWYEGDYSDQGGKKNTGNVYSNVRMADGSAVRVSWTFFRAEKPAFIDSKIEYQYLLSAVRTVYVEAKRLLACFPLPG